MERASETSCAQTKKAPQKKSPARKVVKAAKARTPRPHARSRFPRQRRPPPRTARQRSRSLTASFRIPTSPLRGRSAHPGSAPLATRGQDIESAFDAWQELREHHRAALARLNDDRRALEQQGDFVMGAVRAARADGQGGAALSPGSGLDAYVGDASTKLERAKRELDESAERSRAKWDDEFSKMRAEVRGRIERTLIHVKPLLRLRLRSLAVDKRILHVDRPGPDEAVLLCVLFTGKLPSRYGYLFDDATDNLRETPPSLYAEEGITQANIRPDAHALEALLSRPHDVLPLKAMLLMRVGGSLVRLVERGPVMEAELADGPVFRNVLSRDEAERIAGHLLKLKLDGHVQLELAAD